MVSDRQARIAEIEEQIDILDAEGLRFLLDGFLGNNRLPVELVEATLDVVALIPKDRLQVSSGSSSPGSNGSDG
jgi:hypothetical protein